MLNLVLITERQIRACVERMCRGDLYTRVVTSESRGDLLGALPRMYVDVPKPEPVVLENDGNPVLLSPDERRQLGIDGGVADSDAAAYGLSCLGDLVNVKRYLGEHVQFGEEAGAETYRVSCFYLCLQYPSGVLCAIGLLCSLILRMMSLLRACSSVLITLLTHKGWV